MVNWTNEPQPFGANHTPLLAGVSSVDGVTPVPVAVDPTTGKLLVESGGATGGQTSTVNVVSGTTTATLLLAVNTARLGATIVNDSTANLYVLLHPNNGLLEPSTTLYTVRLVPNAYYEVPFNWTNDILGIWDAINGAALITELT